jgi:hypothetical protein
LGSHCSFGFTAVELRRSDQPTAAFLDFVGWKWIDCTSSVADWAEMSGENAPTRRLRDNADTWHDNMKAGTRGTINYPKKQTTGLARFSPALPMKE